MFCCSKRTWARREYRRAGFSIVEGGRAVGGCGKLRLRGHVLYCFSGIVASTTSYSAGCGKGKVSKTLEELEEGGCI